MQPTSKQQSGIRPRVATITASNDRRRAPGHNPASILPLDGCTESLRASVAARCARIVSGNSAFRFQHVNMEGGPIDSFTPCWPEHPGGPGCRSLPHLSKTSARRAHSL